MCADIRTAYALGATGFLVGCLTDDGHIDGESLRMMCDAAMGRSLHFHVAWELAANPAEALETMIELGIQSVRITGHAPSPGGWGKGAEPSHPIVAADPQAHGVRSEQQMAQVRRIVEQAASRIEFVVVGGVNAENVEGIITGTGVPHVHSGTGVREPPTRQGVVSVKRVRDLARAQTRALAELKQQQGTLRSPPP
jgi:copper homeostasis protein